MRLYNSDNVNGNTDVYRFSDMMRDLFGNTETVNNRYAVPRVNILEEKDAYILSLAVPGLKKSDISLNLDNDVLTISHNSDPNEGNVCYSCREFNYNNFERSFRLPETVNAGKIKASYDEGILNVHLPKRDEAINRGPKEIKIS